MVPALLFLCVGVPLASLLDRLGYFEAVASLMQRRAGAIRLGSLWALACATTAVLNLDTTVVLLTPLYIRLAKRSGVDPFPLALIPLFTASFASSFLPVSNLTTLIAVERLDLERRRRRHPPRPPQRSGLCRRLAGVPTCRAPPRFPPPIVRPIDRRALTIGTLVVAGLLVGFVFGGLVGIEPWMVALVADRRPRRRDALPAVARCADRDGAGGRRRRTRRGVGDSCVGDRAPVDDRRAARRGRRGRRGGRVGERRQQPSRDPDRARRSRSRRHGGSGAGCSASTSVPHCSRSVRWRTCSGGGSPAPRGSRSACAATSDRRCRSWSSALIASAGCSGDPVDVRRLRRDVRAARSADDGGRSEADRPRPAARPYAAQIASRPRSDARRSLPSGSVDRRRIDRRCPTASAPAPAAPN